MQELNTENGMTIAPAENIIPLNVVVSPCGVCTCGATIIGKYKTCWKCDNELNYIPDQRILYTVKRILGNFRSSGDRTWL
jgi:hypothetical protein